MTTAAANTNFPQNLTNFTKKPLSQSRNQILEQFNAIKSKTQNHMDLSLRKLNQNTHGKYEHDLEV